MKGIIFRWKNASDLNRNLKKIKFERTFNEGGKGKKENKISSSVKKYTELNLKQLRATVQF